MRVGVCVRDHPDPASENDIPPDLTLTLVDTSFGDFTGDLP